MHSGIIYRYFLDIPDIYGTLLSRKNGIYGELKSQHKQTQTLSSTVIMKCPCTYMYVGVYMHNVTGALNKECLQTYNCLDEWKCFYAPVS